MEENWQLCFDIVPLKNNTPDPVVLQYADPFLFFFWDIFTKLGETVAQW